MSEPLPVRLCGYERVFMGGHTFSVSKRWIRWNFLKNTLEESSDGKTWESAKEVVEKKELE